jgi:DNA polymerase III delta prime subunit
VLVPEEKEARIPALFLTGPPGSGKTALAHEVSELLFHAGEPHAVIDIDELARGVLPSGSDDFNLALAATNLNAVWANFRALGVRRLVIDRIVLGREDLDHLCHAVPDCEVTVCRVTAPRDEIRNRIGRRESGSAREFLLSMSERIDDALDGSDLPGFAVDNGANSKLTAVAMQILRRLDWPCPTSAPTESA